MDPARHAALGARVKIRKAISVDEPFAGTLLCSREAAGAQRLPPLRMQQKV